jgi:hypothetical protein
MWATLLTFPARKDRKVAFQPLCRRPASRTELDTTADRDVGTRTVLVVLRFLQYFSYYHRTNHWFPGSHF